MKRNHKIRTHAELRDIFIEWEDCQNFYEVMRRTGIPKTTVQRFIKQYGTLADFDAQHAENPQLRPDGSHLINVLTGVWGEQYLTIYENYAYLLGMYLGDGHISVDHKQVHRLSIYLDNHYPGIIERCATAMQTLLPDHRLMIQEKDGCKCVNMTFKGWNVVFPQHGVGLKSKRSIVLEDWQQRIVDTYPLEFLRGLYHSDGSRSQNIVKGKNYPRYFFSNNSDEIRKMFTDACEKLGLEWKQTNARNVAVSRRRDVDYLDQVLGVKA